MHGQNTKYSLVYCVYTYMYVLYVCVDVFMCAYVYVYTYIKYLAHCQSSMYNDDSDPIETYI